MLVKGIKPLLFYIRKNKNISIYHFVNPKRFANLSKSLFSNYSLLDKDLFICRFITENKFTGNIL